jgi:hypothetical protein
VYFLPFRYFNKPGKSQAVEYRKTALHRKIKKSNIVETVWEKN